VGYANLVNHEINTIPIGAIPYWHHYLTLDWNLGSWSATLTENFLKGTYDVFANGGVSPSPQRKIGDYDIWNLSASYTGFTGWQLSAGIKNLFDRDPPFSNQSFSANSGSAPGYDPTYANPIGRVFWAALTYSFK
jgi:iron complex outermembrane receptor protein